MFPLIRFWLLCHGEKEQRDYDDGCRVQSWALYAKNLDPQPASLNLGGEEWIGRFFQYKVPGTELAS
jgi:hypothetical protein